MLDIIHGQWTKVESVATIYHIIMETASNEIIVFGYRQATFGDASYRQYVNYTCQELHELSEDEKESLVGTYYFIVPEFSEE
jgi:hypothetical protein